jgi:hypothetical protein
MGRWGLATLLTIGLLCWPNEATEAQGERVVFDAIVMAVPPAQLGPCLQLEAGQLTVRARNTGDAPWGGRVELRPTIFRLYGYRGSDPAGTVDFPIGERESSITVPLGGALYCWGFDVDAPVTMNSGMAARTNYSQFIALKMTLLPQ